MYDINVVKHHLHVLQAVLLSSIVPDKHRHCRMFLGKLTKRNYSSILGCDDCFSKSLG